MNNSTHRLGIFFGIVASALCAIAGVWILRNLGFPTENLERDPTKVVFPALGLYFLGKAAYVGPHLILTAYQNKSEK